MKTAMDEFHKHYEKSRIWENNKWFGVPMYKLPFDAFVIQELIVNMRPDFIIETGTGYGGSAMFYASICELLREGHVITMDIEDKIDSSGIFSNEWADRITFLHGSSTNNLILDKVKYIINEIWNNNNPRCIVLLDSWHTKEHVFKEMEIYSEFVPVGSYMIVEDSHANGHPVPWEYDDEGPMGAIEKWMELYGDSWEVDYSCEKHLMTFNPKGYLKRIK